MTTKQLIISSFTQFKELKNARKTEKTRGLQKKFKKTQKNG